MSKATRLRRCTACKGKIDAPIMKDQRRHHCVSLEVSDFDRLPETCWRKVFQENSEDVLSALPAYRQKSANTRKQFEIRVALAKDVLCHMKQEDLDLGVYKELLGEYGPIRLAHFISELPQGCDVRESLDNARREYIAENKPPAKPRPKRDNKKAIASLPEDFSKAIELWSEHSKRLAKTKLERGGDYSDYTVNRRINDSIKFCLFLKEQGLKHWPEVSQRHLDLYIAENTIEAGQHAFTFLSHVKRRFRLMHKFIRPRNRGTLIVNKLLDFSEIPKVVRSANDHSDTETSLALLLVALYAQTVKNTLELRLEQIKRTTDGLEIKFAKYWIPLDEITSQKIEMLANDRGLTIPSHHNDDEGYDSPRLLTSGEKQLEYRVSKLANCSLKKLRLTAVANVILSGYSSRASISRALGVSIPTVKEVEKIFPWDLHESLPEKVINERKKLLGVTDD